MGNRTFQIGEAARRAALGVDAIRFYERSKLLPKAPRSAGRFRLYTAEDVSRLRFIRHAKALGFSLAEIRQLIDLRERRKGVCVSVRNLLQAKLADVRGKLGHLRALERELSSDLRRCERQLRQPSTRASGRCRVLAEMDGPAEPFGNAKARNR